MGVNEITLANLANGAMEERFNGVLAEVLENIVNPNTDAKKIRKITLTIAFAPREDREFAAVAFDVKPTLAHARPVGTGIMIGQDGAGKVVAAEYRNTIPGQLGLEDIEGKDKPSASKVFAINKGGN